MPSRRRTSIIIGISFPILGLLYFAFAPVLGYHAEWAGATMLIALGAAIGIMSYVLTSGSGD
ncbi:MAG TPA: hypothetical protein VNH13_07865 [Candidatus Acidoferrales bacterium]|jgi:MFS-type transporter involved in bile tolerance (Atg22 family)|nr:hypothetical protein [Candidatus Acidoferrales bacterium]